MTPSVPSAGEVTPVGRMLHAAAFALLLASLAGRMMLPEMPFRTSALEGLRFSPLADGSQPLLPDKFELAGVTYSVVILVAGALWALGCALAGRMSIRATWLGAGVLLFAALSLVSALRAGDRRAAWEFWTHQVTLMGACWLTVQLCADRRRLGILLAVLAALGAMLAVKGLCQYFVETPQRISGFEMYIDQTLADWGIRPGSPEALVFENRLRASGPLGFFNLANPFASLLIVLLAAAAGLVGDRWLRAWRDRKETHASRPKGEVHLPTVAAVVATAVPVAIAAVILLTRSRGAIGSAVVAALGAVVVLRFGKSLAGRWRTAVLVAGLVAGAGVGAVVACGVVHDRLPTTTLKFRWYYWTGSADIVRERSVWGVGPGNFSPAYLRHRRAEADEAAKTPHNFIMHALAQYGVTGGVCYVLILGGVLAGACRPGRHTDLPPDLPPAGPKNSVSSSPAMVIVWVAAAVIAAPALFAAARGHWGLLWLDGIEPAIVLTVALVLMFWAGGRVSTGAAAAGPVARVALRCGVIGFVLHNLVTFSLLMPGAAMAFWLAAGGAVAQGCGKPRNVSRLRWPLALAGLAAVVLVAAVLWRPVAARARATEMVARRLMVDDGDGALLWARRAMRADTLDAISAADAARLWLRLGGPTSPDRWQREQGYQWVCQAIRRHDQKAAYHRLAADILWGDPCRRPNRADEVVAAMDHMAAAVRRDPQDLRMRIGFARMLVAAGKAEKALVQLAAAEEINRRLLPSSAYRLREKERREVERLKATAQ